MLLRIVILAFSFAGVLCLIEAHIPWQWKLLLQLPLAWICLALINGLSAFIGLWLPINLISVALVGLLGAPALLLLCALAAW